MWLLYRYGLEGLRAACLKVVIATIDLDNVCNHVLLAHDHKCSELFQVRQQAIHEFCFPQIANSVSNGSPTQNSLLCMMVLSRTPSLATRQSCLLSASLCSVAVHPLSHG